MSKECPFQAIRYGDSHAIEALVNKANCDQKNRDGQSLLQEAIAYENQETARWLINLGINVNSTDKSGLTAAHFCGLYKELVILEEILAHGGDVHLADKHGNQPLWTAVFNAKGDYSIVEVLVRAGADPNHKNSYGKSPLDFARQIGSEGLQRILASE